MSEEKATFFLAFSRWRAPSSAQRKEQEAIALLSSSTPLAVPDVRDLVIIAGKRYVVKSKSIVYGIFNPGYSDVPISCTFEGYGNGEITEHSLVTFVEMEVEEL